MTGIIGEAFEDYGTAPECVISSIPAYEVLDGGLIRIFVCKRSGGKHILDHTDIMTRSTLLAIGARLIDIANAATVARDMEIWMSSNRAH